MRTDRTRTAAHRFLAIGLLAAVTAAAAACGSAANVSQAAPAPGAVQTANTAAATAAPVTVHLYMTILTGGQNGKKGWPEYVPGNFTVPANSIVDVEIRDFDDGPATIPTGGNQVKGTIGGTMQVIDAVNGPVEQQPAKTVTEIPANDVAHTLTFATKDFSLNVPIPPLSTVEFSFKAPAAGTYLWQCDSACGSGTSGWSGPMATNGWMQGIMTVTQ